MLKKPRLVEKLRKFYSYVQKNDGKVGTKTRGIDLNFNNACNLRCKYCFTNSPKGDHVKEYLDIGANHPIEINNTYLFYLNDASGVLIEPDPYYINELKNTRPNDLVLNIGLGKEKKLGADFYIMSVRGLNTFDKTQAMKIQNEGDYQIKEIIKVNIVFVSFFKIINRFLIVSLHKVGHAH